MTLTFRYLAKKAGSDDMAIAGTSVRVYTLQCAYEMGESAEYIAENRDLPLPAVFEALAYAYEHPDEMDEIRRRDEEAQQYSLSLLPENLRRTSEKTIQADEQEYREAVREAQRRRLARPVP